MGLGESLRKIVVKMNDTVELAKRFCAAPRSAMKEVVVQVREVVIKGVGKVAAHAVRMIPYRRPRSAASGQRQRTGQPKYAAVIPSQLAAAVMRATQVLTSASEHSVPVLRVSHRDDHVSPRSRDATRDRVVDVAQVLPGVDREATARRAHRSDDAETHRGLVAPREEPVVTTHADGPDTRAAEGAASQPLGGAPIMDRSDAQPRRTAKPDGSIASGTR